MDLKSVEEVVVSFSFVGDFKFANRFCLCTDKADMAIDFGFVAHNLLFEIFGKFVLLTSLLDQEFNRFGCAVFISFTELLAATERGNVQFHCSGLYGAEFCNTRRERLRLLFFSVPLEPPDQYFLPHLERGQNTSMAEYEEHQFCKSKIPVNMSKDIALWLALSATGG